MRQLDTGSEDANVVRFLLDGEVRSVANPPPTRTVLDFLREDLRRTGTKEGCAEGDCGACTVVLAELDTVGNLLCRAANSCIQFLPTLDGKALFTVESLKRGHRLHPVQQAMADSHGSQCGFCTPGFIMSLFALYKTEAAPTRADVDDALAGNLCRCTGYRPIVAAAREMYALGAAQSEEEMDWTSAPRGRAGAAVKEAESKLIGQLQQLKRSRPLVLSKGFFAPRTVTELAQLRAELPEARLLAGGTDVGLWVTKQLRDPGPLIYVGEVAELRRVEQVEGYLDIGAGATFSQLLPLLSGEFPGLAAVLRRFASPPIRNAATLGGNIANGSPIGDSMPCLIALGTKLVLRSRATRREMALEDFYLDYRKTALGAGEFVEKIRIPLASAGQHIAAYKVSKRFDQDISGVLGAFMVELRDGLVSSARVAYGGLAAIPKRARHCEAALCGKPWSEQGIASAADALAEDFNPIDDMRASAAYRMRVARNLLRRFYLENNGRGHVYATRVDQCGDAAAMKMGAPGGDSGGSGLAVGHALRHESAHLHVAGEATYVDDSAELQGSLHAAFGLSARAHARILSMDLARVRAAPGVVAVLIAADIPGQNNFGAVTHDDPILADGIVHYMGQPIFVVAALTRDEARRAARLADLLYEDLDALLDLEEALARREYVLPSVTLERGDWQAALLHAPHRLKGRLKVGGQEQFYLEGQIAYAVPREDGEMLVHSSTQHPTEVQHMVAHALGVEIHKVTVECRRTGGGFGGKETQPALFACAAGVLARHLERPVKLRVDRDDDFLITGKRHDFVVDYDVGFDESGSILGLDVSLASRCGYSADLSGPVNDRAVMHLDNCYFLENVRVVSHRCRTNTQSATAFRGFGGPQGMMAGEYVVDEVARHLGLDPLLVRQRNFYGPGARGKTHYGMQIEDFIADALVARLAADCSYAERRAKIREWNATSPIIKRGIALTPVKFGISFTASHLNQAGALVHIYTDGSVLLNHGGTEMGQGLHTKVAQVVAEEFQIDLARVRVSATNTSKVPNTAATAASSGSDLNGKAAQAAAGKIRSRLIAFAAQRFGVAPEAVRFERNRVHVGDQDLAFEELVRLAFTARVQLWADGFYRTPKIGYDPKTLRGRPFFYFCYGAAVAEVAIDTLTGESKLLRVDILHDVGRSINPAIDIGQIEGGFIQGMGWLTSEDLVWDRAGGLLTHSPSTYKIPVAGDVPEQFNVALWKGENVEDSIHRSKAVGEPPLMLGIAVFHAIKDAVASVTHHRRSPVLNAPATPEEILRAVDALRSTGAA